MRVCGPLEGQPVINFGRLEKNVQEMSLMVAFEKCGLVLEASLIEKIEGVAGIGAAVDIVTQIDFEHAVRRTAGRVGIDQGEHVREQISTSMDVTKGIDPNTFGQPGRLHNLARSQKAQHTEFPSPALKIAYPNITLTE
jgi:hypothetical protein